MDVYQYCINSVKDGKRVHINMEAKTIKVNREVIFNDGKTDYDTAINKQDMNELYENYKVSLPGRSSLCNRPYFKAKRTCKMTDTEMIIGEDRDIAQVQLEAYLLLAFYYGIEQWDNPFHWYMQMKDKGFIILKNWVI